MKEINALGLACPTPVIMAKKEIGENPGEAVVVAVDNDVARNNLRKLADSLGYQFSAEGEEPEIFCTLSPDGAEVEVAEEAPKAAAGTDYVVFFGKDIVGEGDRELGTNLVRMFFYALTESDDLPTAILFMNAGVKLTTLDDQVIENLKVLKDRGVDILSCGACLDFYGLKDKLQVGEISNMYEISQRIIHASKEVVM